MKYKIQSEIFDNYPDLRVGIVVGKNLKNSNINSDLRRQINENCQNFLKEYNSQNLLDHPNISAWRKTYQSFGVKPKDHKPTAEALLKRVINNHPFPNINTAVDAYLAVELVYLLPIGGYDIDKVNGDIYLRYSKGEEIFYPLGSDEPEYTKQGEVVYSDKERVLTRRWNYRDSDFTKITIESKNIILASEATYPLIKTSDLENTINLIIKYESEFCGGTFESYFLDKKKPEIEL